MIKQSPAKLSGSILFGNKDVMGNGVRSLNFSDVFSLTRHFETSNVGAKYISEKERCKR